MATANKTVKKVLEDLHKYKVIESWRSGDGSSWYRKWSDGLIEQGVTYVGNPSRDFFTEVTLPTSFSTTSYNVLAQAFKLDKNFRDRAVTTDVYGKTTSSVYCGWFIYESADVTSIYVYARGY